MSTKFERSASGVYRLQYRPPGIPDWQNFTPSASKEYGRLNYLTNRLLEKRKAGHYYPNRIVPNETPV